MNNNNTVALLCSVLFCSRNYRGQFLKGFLLLNTYQKSTRKTCLDGIALDLLCIGLLGRVERNPFNCVRLSSVSELIPTQSNGLSSSGFDFFG